VPVASALTGCVQSATTPRWLIPRADPALSGYVASVLHLLPASEAVYRRQRRQRGFHTCSVENASPVVEHKKLQPEPCKFSRTGQLMEAFDCTVLTWHVLAIMLA